MNAALLRPFHTSWQIFFLDRQFSYSVEIMWIIKITTEKTTIHNHILCVFLVQINTKMLRLLFLILSLLGKHYFHRFQNTQTHYPFLSASGLKCDTQDEFRLGRLFADGMVLQQSYINSNGDGENTLQNSLSIMPFTLARWSAPSPHLGPGQARRWGEGHHQQWEDHTRHQAEWVIKYIDWHRYKCLRTDRLLSSPSPVPNPQSPNPKFKGLGWQ